MPRGKKDKGLAGVDPKTRIRDNELADFWTTLINRGLDAKKNYTATAKLVETYLGTDHSALYQDTNFMDFKGSSAVTIPKIAQMRNTLGPRLYQTKPVRTITPRTEDGVMLGLARCLEATLNYTVRECNFKKQLRRSIDDGLIRGRGFLFQDIEPVRGMPTSRFVSSMDVVFDPDFEEIEDAKWIAFRCSEPLWETKRRVTEKWRTKNLGRDADITTHKGPDDKRESKESISSDQVTYWRVFSKMGAGFRGMEKSSRRDDTKDFVYLEIVLDHEVPLAEGPWEVPFYLDKDWPLSHFDPIDPVGTGWPDSIGGQVLGSQQAIDLLSSLRLSSCKNRDRTLLIGDKDLMDPLAIHTLRHGTAADFIGLSLNQGKTLADVVMPINFGVGSQESLVEREYHTQQIEVTTGVTDALHGGQEAGAKDRSATASQIRSDAANARVSDLRDRVETFHADAARKEAIITRLMLDAEDISPIVRAGQINLYWVHVEVPGASHVRVRDVRPKEEREKGPGPELTLEDLSPQASNFFQDPMQAMQAAVTLLQEMMASNDPRVISLAASIMGPADPMTGMALDVDPMTGLPPSIFVDVVTPEIVWEATAGISAEELVREFSYELAAGSGHQLNKEAMQQNADYLVQTVMPSAMSVFQASGDPEVLNRIMEIRNNAFDVPQEQRIQFKPMMLPQPGGGEGGPPKDKGE